MKLPILDVIPQIKESLNTSNTIILEAPAGAGKSTIVPISLINEPFLENKKILVLEPRRVAARAVAKQMAKLLGEDIGKTVGYQIKMESCFSANTKVLVVTEGILTRKLQNDQTLDDFGMVIFDEFHERSIHTDLGLALCCELQELLRDDLKLLIMSATLNSTSLEKLLPSSITIRSKGRVFPIEEVYLHENIKHPTLKTINTLLLDTILNSLINDNGDILVFLPGLKEIRYLEEELTSKVDSDILILPLHSSLLKEEQDRAIEKQKKRKIILSTNLAQTSLTIEGIEVVIDSGLEKVSKFNYKSFMNYLEYSFITQDSAIQRAGRAGRLKEGKCYKLWHKSRILEESLEPQILKTDLSSLILELSLWGVEDFYELKFLDFPKKEKIDSSRKSLQDLEMLDSNYKISSYGKRALSLGLHPRLAHMILKAEDLGLCYEACLLASILQEVNMKNSLEESFDSLYYEHKVKINRFLEIRIKKQAKEYLNRLGIKTINKNKKFNSDMLSVLLLFAYPDRLAKQRVANERSYKLSNGKGAILNNQSKLFNKEYIVISSIEAKANDSYIYDALEIKFDYLNEYFPMYIKKQAKFEYQKENNKITNYEQVQFLNLVLYEEVGKKIKQEEFILFILKLLREEKLSLLNISVKAQNLIDRVNFINKLNLEDINLPSFTNESLINSLHTWLKPYLTNINSLKELFKLDIYTILHSTIPWDNQQKIDILAPSFIEVPSGSKIKIDYSNINKPILKVKIQEVFGLNESPKIAKGKINLQIHLLSPAQRAIQITDDLKSFWDNSYDEVKKELKGKYKKHYWPDNPYEAIATNKTKKYM